MLEALPGILAPPGFNWHGDQWLGTKQGEPGTYGGISLQVGKHDWMRCPPGPNRSLTISLCFFPASQHYKPQAGYREFQKAHSHRETPCCSQPIIAPSRNKLRLVRSRHSRQRHIAFGHSVTPNFRYRFLPLGRSSLKWRTGEYEGQHGYYYYSLKRLPFSREVTIL